MSRGDAKIVVTGDEVREKALAGAKIAYEAVACAYGPTSGNVALQKSYGGKVFTHDGVSIIREINLSDELMDTGVDLLNSASSKSNDVTGDGTSATVLLGYHIMRLANKRISAGYNSMGLRRGIDKASVWIKDELDKLAVPVLDDRLHEVASISASDSEVGKLVADTVVKVGGVGITVEEYDGLGVIQTVVEGLYFEKGWDLPHFVTDRETEEAVHENVSILVTEKRINTTQDIAPLLEMVFNDTDHKTVLVVGNIGGKALETCALTNHQGKVKVCVVAPPVYGDQVLGFLEDVACMTGGKLIPNNMPVDKVTVDYLGNARKIIVSQTNTTILEGNAIQEDVNLRIATLKKQMKDSKYNQFQRERMEMRLAKLQGKIGIIKVGGATEGGRKEMKFRVEDAVHATRCAKEEGVVPGGAVTLAQLITMKNMKDDGTFEMPEDELQGFMVVMEALAEPFKQLMTNAGEDSGHCFAKVLEAKAGWGYDVKNMTTEPIDLSKAGVLDPVKVIKSVVENAAEVAGIAITLNGSITYDRQHQLDNVAITRASQGTA